MKHITRLAFLSLIILTTEAAHAQVASADSAIQKIFASLKAKDEKAFLTMYPSGSQMVALVRNMMETMFKSEAMQQMMAADEKSKNLNIDSLIEGQVKEMSKPETQAQMQKGFVDIYQRLIENGEAKGVNWSEAKLTSYTIDSASAGDDMGMGMGSTGLKYMKGIIDFNSAGTDYQLRYDKIIYLPTEGGWYGGEFKKVIKKGEEFTEEDEEMADDSLMAIMDKMEVDSVAVKPKAKTKTKTKTPTSKTKIKTKTPARKPATKS